MLHDLLGGKGQHLTNHVAIAKRQGALTPEDPYAIVDHQSGPLRIAPLFLLYDYSFRPPDVAQSEVIAWAEEKASVCADEYLLFSDPYNSRGAWYAARCVLTEARLSAYDPTIPTVLVNHFPLRQELAVLPFVPRFTPWCGTV